MKTLQLLCPEHSERAAHLGEKSCLLDIGQTRGQVCLGFVLCRTLIKDNNFILLFCLTKISVKFESTESLPVLFTIVSAVPRTMPGIY